MDQPVYRNNDTYNRAVAAIAAATLRPAPCLGVPLVDAIKIAIGEHLNVWPASIRTG